ELKEVLKHVAEQLNSQVQPIDNSVEVKYYEKSEFEVHLKFSGDTLIFMMHTNIFDFDQQHYIHNSPYVKEDPMREFCGMIQIYNFLADSIKYNREGDVGYLVGRLFINKDLHFFIEGKRPLAYLFGDFGANKIEKGALEQIIVGAINYCLNFDLIAPPIENMSFITLEQKNLMSYSSGMPTGKLLGFRSHLDNESRD
ncbi:MAG: hypothetical protein MH472_07060, partial [Bacteroidia bacterium]|nr:hypothetical protein [Bacteroidia bacterium]